ncbi:MAG: transglutaminase family protein [Isosphaeraceae bacterium]
MPIQVALNHRTSYRFDRLVSLLPHVVRLRPAPHCRTPILSYSLRVTPLPHFLNWQQDPYSNHLARLVFPEPVRELNFEVDLIAEMTVINPFDFFIEDSAGHYPFTYEPLLARELIPYLETETAGPRLRSLVAELRRSDVRTVDYIVELNRRVHERIRYLIRLEPGVQTCERTLELASGSCRDSGWLLVQLLRQLGLAARFVSGYLIQLKPDVPALDGPSGPEEDFTDLHAWAEVYLPGAGWVGLDATSGLLAGEGHIPLACTADPQTAAPITGSYSWTVHPDRGEKDTCGTDFTYHMSVRRFHEDPRVTKPYTDEQWRAIEDLGHEIDEHLRRGDVRLTMGGEPTFVSIDDMDGEEWNTAALGDAKRRIAGGLLKSLRDRFASGGLLIYGQGKLYPGEPLPRWALGCFWRIDGEPIWQDPGLIADEAHDYGHTEADARRFITTLAGSWG